MIIFKKILILVFGMLCCASIYAQKEERNSAIKTKKEGIHAPKDLCIDVSSNALAFYDFKNYVLATNYFTKQQYIYWKKERRLTSLTIDSNAARDIYLDFLKDPAGYKDYLFYSGTGQFKPKLVYTCPFNDTTVLGLLMIYKTTVKIKGIDTSVRYDRIPAIIEFTEHAPAKMVYVNEYLPIADHFVGSEMYAYKGKIYFVLSANEERLLKNEQEIKLVASFTKKKATYAVDRIEPDVMHDYLIKGRIFSHYNQFFADNGFVLMSLSNYILNQETNEKIMLPIADSVFRNLKLNRDNSIDYWVSDFKYNVAEKRFYIIYHLNGQVFAASFKPGANAFDQQVLLWSETSAFIKTIKDARLSWDGKRVAYMKKGARCMQYASFAELQELEKNYVPPPPADEF